MKEEIRRGTPADQAQFDLLQQSFRCILDIAEPWTEVSNVGVSWVRFRVKGFAQSVAMFQRNMTCATVYDRDFDVDTQAVIEGSWENPATRWEAHLTLGGGHPLRHDPIGFPTREEAMDWLDEKLRGDGWVLP